MIIKKQASRSFLQPQSPRQLLQLFRLILAESAKLIYLITSYPMSCAQTFSTECLPTQSRGVYVRPGHHLPIVKYSRSPISPRPGLIIPLWSVSLSTPPTHSSTPSGQASAAL